MEGLSPDAAIHRVDGQRWTVRDELLALILERVDHWGLAQAHIQTRGKAKGLSEKSMEVPRPGEASGAKGEDRVITDPKVIAAFFG